ncbi:MAG TPA: sigma-70 family RNA polymerase sigma factor [Chthoniobacterales bacterium]
MWSPETPKLAIRKGSSRVSGERKTSERMASDTSIDQQLEIELLKQVGQGNRKSFEELYDRFSGVLFSAALQILNDQREAEDVLQDVFIQIWDKAQLYNAERGKPLTWAMTLTRNKAIDRLRSAQRRYRLQDQVEKETTVLTQVLARDSSEEVDALEKSRIIRAAVLQLSLEQREAIELAFFSGLTQNEIAQELNQPLGTVKARIRRGMLKLKELIASRL